MDWRAPACPAPAVELQILGVSQRNHRCALEQLLGSPSLDLRSRCNRALDVSLPLYPRPRFVTCKLAGILRTLSAQLPNIVKRLPVPHFVSCLEATMMVSISCTRPFSDSTRTVQNTDYTFV